MRVSKFAPLVILGFLLPFGALACGDRPGLIRAPIPGELAAAKPQALPQPTASPLDNHETLDNNSARRNREIVGMWVADFFVGSTTQIYDRAILIFYADGNEAENDIAVPPATENVCYGVWERVGQDTFKVRHLGWVFDLSGAFAGTLEVVATISLTNDGTALRGKYVLEQYDLAGNVITTDHAEGDIKAARYTIRNGMKH